MTVADRADKANERVAPTRSVVNRGLCVACRRDQVCHYPRNTSRPVLQCEEFEGHEPRAKNPVAHEESTVLSRFRDPVQAEVKGLCITCVNRNTCAFPKPAGGIWHCEEFR